MDKLTRTHIAYLLKVAGLLYPSGHINIHKWSDDRDRKIKETIPVFVFQNLIQEKKEGQNIYIDIDQQIKLMETQNTKKIIVNLSYHGIFFENKSVFFSLGEYIKKNQVDLYIEGRCSYLCANYLLPAARTVYIGPYGHIASKGSLAGLSRDVENTMPLQLEEIGKQLAGITYFLEGNIAPLKYSFRISFQKDSKEESEKVWNNFYTNLENWEGRSGKLIIRRLNIFLAAREENSFLDLM